VRLLRASSGWSFDASVGFRPCLLTTMHAADSSPILSVSSVSSIHIDDASNAGPSERKPSHRAWRWWMKSSIPSTSPCRTFSPKDALLPSWAPIGEGVIKLVREESRCLASPSTTVIKGEGRSDQGHLGFELGVGYRLRPRALLGVRLAGRRGLWWALDIDAALIEPEWRVAISHQRHINQQPVAPPIDSKCQVKKARRITRREQQRDGRDQHTRADQARRGIANRTAVLHACRHDITGADKRADDEILREGEQPLDQRQPTIQLLRVLKVQPRRVVGDIGESERWIPVGSQGRITVKSSPATTSESRRH
jgi:hypothetical protein